MDLFDTLTWAKIVVETTLLVTITLILPFLGEYWDIEKYW